VRSCPVTLPLTRVSLFITCLNDTLFPQTGRAVVTVLERLGVAVDFPLEQTCCGQMHFNTGYAQEAIPLVRRFVRAFADAEVIVSPSASCVGMVRDAFPQLARRSADESLVAAVDGLVPRVLELTELLVDRLGVEDVGAFPAPRQLSPDLPQPARARVG
jgi:L-lactate dehydrogenase complex protein LldE